MLFLKQNTTKKMHICFNTMWFLMRLYASKLKCVYRCYCRQRAYFYYYYRGLKLLSYVHHSIGAHGRSFIRGTIIGSIWVAVRVFRQSHCRRFHQNWYPQAQFEIPSCSTVALTYDTIDSQSKQCQLINNHWNNCRNLLPYEWIPK